MNDIKRLFIMLCIGGIITLIYRELPFLVFQKRKIPDTILYVGRVLPMAIMGMLVLYCIKGTTFESATGFLPQLTALAILTAVHIWKRNTTLSIFMGTAIYMILIRIV